MKLYLSIIATALMSFGAAAALPLQSLPPNPTFDFDPSEDGDIPTCDQVMERIQRLQKITEESQLSVIGFMEESAGVMQGWHDALQPLEGQQAAIPSGTFSPLQEGAGQIFEVTQLAYQNADYVILELQKVTQALTKCLPRQGNQKSKGVPVGLSKNQ